MVALLSDSDLQVVNSPQLGRGVNPMCPSKVDRRVLIRETKFQIQRGGQDLAKSRHESMLLVEICRVDPSEELRTGTKC